jgi:hypothetical protein
MERITYRKTLDVHKTGVQFTLQGFVTTDRMARTIEINLMANGDTVDLPTEKMVAIVYVTAPSGAVSVNDCTIKDNTIVYNVLPIVEAGITEMQVELIETSPMGAESVLTTPKFAVEVSESGTNEESATNSPTFTALENALAQAKGLYDSRITRIILSEDCVFTIHYADGSIYTSDALKDLVVVGESLMSKSYARGGTGVRDGEDADNSMYYSNVSKSAALNSNQASDRAESLLTEVKKHGVYTAFTTNFESGELEYESPMYTFEVDATTGELLVNGISYSIDNNIKELVRQVLKEENIIQS